MADPTLLQALVADGELDVELAALLAVLAEHGVPIVFAAPHPGDARRLNQALGASAGGVVIADSLDAVLRLSGAPFGALTDAARDLGVIVIHDGRRVLGAHYLRPVERDAAGHLQRRPPATLGAWNEPAGRFDHFAWAIHDELATRAGLARDEFETQADRFRAELTAGARA